MIKKCGRLNSLFYRLGRAIYMKARGEINNNIGSNGELMVQRSVLNACEDKVDVKFVVFDVGANIGDWSTEMLDLSQKCRKKIDLRAFEPVASTAATLRKNLSKYKNQWLIEEMACSSKAGETEIFVLADNAGTNSLHQDCFDHSSIPVRIRLTTVHDYCIQNNICHIHLLKCDTEGHDMDVIRGSLPLLVAGKISVLQFEYNHRWIYSRNYLRDIFQMIEKIPYKLAKLQADHIIFIARWNPEMDRFFEGNYLLVHEDATDWFPHVNCDYDQSNVLNQV